MSVRHIPRLHLVTDDDVLARSDFAELASSALLAGRSSVALHLRSARAAGARLFALAAELARVASSVGARVVVNDRADVALAARCDGVQLGGGAMSLGEARKLLGPELLIGASVHGAEEAAARAGEGADFLVAGSIYRTRSHPAREPAGSEWLRTIARLPLPVVAIGGVTPTRVDEVLSAGAHGVAVVSGVWAAASPVVALQEYLAALDAA